MKIKLNGIFFGCFFLAAFLAEMYCLLLPADFFTIGGLAIVVLISLYLLLDSLRSQWKQEKERLPLYLENLFREESEKNNSRYTELLNLQKASYTAIKKNTAMLDEKLEELTLKLKVMEKSKVEDLNKIAELLKKIMDGQKNALNIEVNYQKENTKALMEAIREEIGKLNPEDKLDLLTEALGEHLKPIYSSSHDSQQYEEDSFREEEQESEAIQGFKEEEPETEAIQGFKEEEPATEPIQNIKEEESEVRAVPEIVPLYDDPNKNLSREEIAAMFAAYGQ